MVYDGNANCSPGKQCSLPQGFRIKDSRLLCADSYRGLVAVDLETGKVLRIIANIDLRSFSRNIQEYTAISCGNLRLL